MHLQKLLATTLLTIALTSTAFARGGQGGREENSCQNLENRFNNVSMKIEVLDREIEKTQSRLNHAQFQLMNKQSEIHSAESRVRDAENAISKLHHEFNNGPEIISGLQQENLNLKALTPRLEQEAQALEKAYHDISGNFFKRLKKLKAKSKWNKKLNEIADVQNKIVQNRAEIEHIKHVQSNFNELLFQAELRLEDAKEDLSFEESKLPTEFQLERQVHNLRGELQSQRMEKSGLESRLENIRHKLESCHTR